MHRPVPVAVLFAATLLPALAPAAAHAAPVVDDPRALAPEATFADVVKAAGALAAAPDRGVSTAGCLLRRPGPQRPPRLEASLAPALAELPPPPVDLDAPLETRRNASLLGPTARVGSEDAGLRLVALTPVPNSVLQRALLPLLVRTDKATWFTAIAAADTFQGGGAKPTRLDAAGLARVRAEILPNAPAMVVAAEGATPIAALIETLALLDGFKGPVLLATPLPDDARLPDRPESGTARDLSPRDRGPGFCDRDVMSIPPGQRPGELPMTQMWRATEKLRRDVAKACEAAAAPSGGGILQIAMRVGRNGRPTGVCIEKDPTHDKKLRACVIAAVQRMVFPKPVGGTFVNFGTDVTITPRDSAQRALCAD